MCDTIVVSGDMTDEDLVWSYFEGRRSGGNKNKEVESVKTIKKGVFHVKFSNSEGMYMYIYTVDPQLSEHSGTRPLPDMIIIYITVTTSCTNLTQSDEWLHSTYIGPSYCTVVSDIFLASAATFRAICDQKYLHPLAIFSTVTC